VNAEQDAALHREQLALAGRVEALGEMTASIAHELNQPLAAITLYAKTAERILANNPTEDGVVESILEKISAQALRAGQVIKQVRSLVEKSAHEAETHDLREIVQEALRLGAVDARASGIQLIVEMGDKPLWVNADPIQIQQVLLNLMRNALDALVSCQPATPCIEVFVSADYDKASVEVRDNGPGVDSDILANLFRPFITNKEHGMGIGLSLSDSIVKRHQGSLEHVAAYSGGTCFKMSLPLIQFASDSKVT
jgi:C4-dicarboxylate-specific signal transduction histidine kinase